LFEAALALHTASLKEMVEKSRLESSTAETALMELINNGQLVVLEDGTQTVTSNTLAIAVPHWNTWSGKILQTIEAYHKQFPLRRGIPREELKSKLKLLPRIFNVIINRLITSHSITDHTRWLAKPEHEIRFDGADQVKAKDLLRMFEKNPYSTPSLKECQSEAGEEVVNALIELGELVAVSQEVLFRKKDYQALVEKVRAAIEASGEITLAEARDVLNTTRKYAQALLEYLDAIGVTVRSGDTRRLRK
jgi:selenocysteine-specific elongation factor